MQMPSPVRQLITPPAGATAALTTTATAQQPKEGLIVPPPSATPARSLATILMPAVREPPAEQRISMPATNRQPGITTSTEPASAVPEAEPRQPPWSAVSY